MPISKKHGLCFIHIPKNAGSSIEKSLGMCHPENLWSIAALAGYDVCPQHLNLRELLQVVPGLNALKIFSIVRNPFDRLVSEYFYTKSLPHTSEYHDLDFDTYVDKCLCLRYDLRKKIFDAHLETQASFLKLPLRHRILGGLKIKVFKYENLNEVFCWLRLTTGLELEFGHERKSDRPRDYREFYQRRSTRERVEAFYKEDLSVFNYSF